MVVSAVEHQSSELMSVGSVGLSTAEDSGGPAYTELGAGTESEVVRF